MGPAINRETEKECTAFNSLSFAAIRSYRAVYQLGKPQSSDRICLTMPDERVKRQEQIRHK